MKRSFLFLFTLVCLFVVSGCLSAPSYKGVTQDSVFVSGSEGYRAFRIPSILTVNNRILAFAEGRVNGFSDTGDINLVMKYSDDGGLNWSPLKSIWDDELNSCGNPTPVVITLEDGSKRIIMVATWNDGRDHESEIKDGKSRASRLVYTFYSDDMGESWSDPVDITSQVKSDDWNWYATGPGIGIVLSKGSSAGRIIIPCDHFDTIDKQYHSHLIYSDNQGESWNIGAIAPAGSNESQLVEKSNGELLIIMRRVSSVYSDSAKLIGTSQDAGLSILPASVLAVVDTEIVETTDDPDAIAETVDLSAFGQDSRLVSPVCQASILYSESEGRLWFSNPESDVRKNMTLKVSYDEGENWSRKIVLWPGASAYSSLAVDSLGRLLCLYEGGRKFAYSGIRLAIIEPFVLAEGGSPVVLPKGKKEK